MPGKTHSLFLERYPFDCIVYDHPSYTEIINPHFPRILSCIRDEIFRLQGEGHDLSALYAGDLAAPTRDWYHCVTDHILDLNLSLDNREFSFLITGYRYSYSSASAFSYITLLWPPLWSSIRDQTTEYTLTAEQRRKQTIPHSSCKFKEDSVLCRVDGSDNDFNVTLLSDNRKRGPSKAFRLRKILL